MVNDKGNLATLLVALSYATGVGFGGHIEHGLGSASLGLQIADALALADEEREAIFYGALLKDVACTACSAGIAAFFPDEEQVFLSDVILLDPSQLSDMNSKLFGALLSSSQRRKPSWQNDPRQRQSRPWMVRASECVKCWPTSLISRPARPGITRGPSRR